MGSGKLLHKEGPMHDKVFCPVLVLRRGYLSIGKLFFVAALQCRVDFIQIKMTAVIDKLESYCIHALVNSFFGNQQVYRFKLCKTYMMHFI